MTNEYKIKVLNLAIYAGEIMMKSGAEIYRVEDTIMRICKACGIKNVGVFMVPTGMFISLHSGNDEDDTSTYIKRVKSSMTDMTKISRVNEFSRHFTTSDMTIDEAMGRLRIIDNKKRYPTPLKLLGAAMIAAFFCVMFDGNWTDAIVAAVAGVASYSFSLFISKYEINYFIHGLLSTAVASLVAMLASTSIVGASYQPIIVGALMIFVPGAAITNSIRDFLAGDMLSGLARLTESVITAASLAVGAGIIIYIWHTMGGVIS